MGRIEEGGLLDTLHRLTGGSPGRITASHALGVSCVEKNPDDRAFDFYIASEVAEDCDVGSLERYVVPACRWAIFGNRGQLPMALVDAEMHAFMQWLPASPYRHANAPELEVYPAHDGSLVEFWLPVVLKG